VPAVNVVTLMVLLVNVFNVVGPVTLKFVKVIVDASM
jgi:hypothetical protein